MFCPLFCPCPCVCVVDEDIREFVVCAEVDVVVLVDVVDDSLVVFENNDAEALVEDVIVMLEVEELTVVVVVVLIVVIVVLLVVVLAVPNVLNAALAPGISDVSGEYKNMVSLPVIEEVIFI